jgi:cytochrome c oxidase cbb3-type subunit 4
MELTELIKQIMANWTLVSLFTFFVGAIIWSFRPGSRVLHDDAAAAVFRHDEPMACSGACPGCACGGAAMARAGKEC